MDKYSILHISNRNLYIIQKFVLNLILIAIGFLSARTAIMGNFPLGVSFVSAASGGLILLSAVIGTSVGYFSLINTSISIRYISTLVSICAIRWTFSSFKKFNKQPKYIIFLTFVPVFITGIAFNSVYGLNFNSITKCLLESVIASGMAYILNIGFKSLGNYNYKYKINSEYILPIFAILVITIPITNFSFYSINIINILIIILVLSSSYIFKLFGGSIAGIIRGIFYIICKPSNYIQIISSPITGMIAGSFSKLGRIFIVLSYIFSNLILHFQLSNKILISEIIEEIIASIIFLIISNKINFKNFRLKNNINSENLKSFAVQNISLMGNSFDNAKDTFEKVTNELDKKYKSDSKTLVKFYLKSISQIYNSILKSINLNSKIDEDLSIKIKNMIKTEFKINSKISLVTNNLGKFLLQIEFDKFNVPKDLERLREEMHYVCQRAFMKPEIFYNQNNIIMKFCEKTKFRVIIQAKQHISIGETRCGDSYKNFYDGLGNFYVILSDGMGKGDMASISGNIVTHLTYNMLRSGVELEPTVFIINSILMEKSSDESLATLDILKVNLFTGKAVLLKLGAASSFIKSEKKILKIPSNLPPIGILPEVKIKKIPINFKDNDLIMMFSDGVTDTGEDWVSSTINDETNDMDLTDIIIKMAQKFRINNSDDDITAISIKFIQNF
ncbi:MAG: SpoIIE family protein phosphatase [Clostridia bacterium]|nr:SpoIIE family protein phosphatase [Clostridia bacterium]